MGQTPHLIWDDYSRWSGPAELPVEKSALWPPLYPMLMAAAGGFAFDARLVAGPFNAIAFGLTAFVAGLWMRLYVRSRFLVAMGCAAIVFSVTLAYWASWAFSEITFILLVTLALFFGTRYLTTGKTTALVLAAVFTALACVTRYSGIVLILAIVSMMALRRGPDLSERLRSIGLYAIISVAPLGVWLLRNYMVTETLTGPRGTSRYGDLVTQVGRGLSSVEAWNPLMVDIRSVLLPVDIYAGRIIGVGVAGIILMVLAALALWGFWRWYRKEENWDCLALAGTYAFCHIAFTMANAPSGYLLLDSRQMLPAYVPLIVVIVIAADMLMSNRDRLAFPKWLTGTPVIGSLASGRERILPTVAVSALVVCISYAGFVSVRDTHTAVFNPEYGWNAYVYNADSVDIQTTSASEYLEELVGDAEPMVTSHFDLYIGDGSLIYFRDGCSLEDFERRIHLRVEPVNKLALSGIRKNFGVDFLGFYPSRQGIILDGKCLMVAPLPEYDIERITTGQSSNLGNVEFWDVSFAPSA